MFATETLAVGINMPARTVVIEKLTKFTGDHHEMLTAGEYTQLTGRAGRRGIDDEGHAVVLWSPFVPFEQVATLAVEPDVPPPLGVPPDVQHGRQPRRHATPASRPTTCSTCRSRSTSRTATSCASRPGWSGCGPSSAPPGRAAESPYGDIWDYRRSLDEIRARRRGPRRPGLGRHGPAAARARSSTPSKGRYRGPVAVVASAHRKGGMRLTTVTTRADLLLLTPEDFDDVPRSIGTVRLPTVFSPNRAEYRKRGRPGR